MWNKIKVIALIKYPQFFFSILKSEKVHLGGLGIVCIFTDYVVKIRILKRIKEIEEEEKERGFLLLSSLEEERDKFIFINHKHSFIQRGRLYLEKIDGNSLSIYIKEDDLEQFLYFFEKSIKILLQKYKESGFYHGDFHVDNIILNKKDIFFIDFEFKYVEELNGYELEADILKFVFYLKIYKKDFFIKYRKEIVEIILKYFESERLKYAEFVMHNYLKDEMNEIL